MRRLVQFFRDLALLPAILRRAIKQEKLLRFPPPRDPEADERAYGWRFSDGNRKIGEAHL